MDIRNQLLKLGMKDNEIDFHESDLYVLKNDISNKFINDYEFKNIVGVFTSQIDNKQWYDIPFGNMDNHYKNKRGFIK